MTKKGKVCEEKKCMICNKPFDYQNDMFGRGCLNNLYKQLDISVPKYTLNKEKHLINTVSHKNSKYFLSKDKKEAVLKNAIALSYLNLIKLDFTEKLKKELVDNIRNISVFKPLVVSMEPVYLLNSFYKVYNYYVKFDKELSEAKLEIEKLKSQDDINKNIDEIIDETKDKTILKEFSFIFNSSKELIPLYHMAFYDMQYIFWETVVVGGYLFDKPLSGYLLRLSLNNKEEYDEENPLIIESEYFNKLLFEYDEFKRIINKYLKGKEVNVENQNVEFLEGDLLFAIHGAKLNIKGNIKENGKWNLTVEIVDKYDYTDPKEPKEYTTSFSSKSKNILASTLNNFAAISSSYGVIRPFDYVIKVKNNDYKMKD